MKDLCHQGSHTWDGIHPRGLYPSHQGRRVQQRDHHLHRIANDHECATKPPFRKLALLQASLNPLLLALLSAEGDLATHREVGTNVWCDGPYVTRLRDHDAPGQHATVEQKSPHPIVMPQVVSTT